MRLIPAGVALILLATGLGACGTAHSDDGDADVTEATDEGIGEVHDDGSSCEAGLEPCGIACVDTHTDPANCGACGTTCGGGLHATGACAGGSCGLACDTGWVDVDGEPGCEYECTAAVPPTEICNGLDDDCNGLPDDPFECVRGATDSCTTTCGTAGQRSCDDACVWQCIPPAETCDSLDQNCDGVADESLYGALWNVVGAETTAPRAILSFTLVVGGGEAAIGYVRTEAASDSVGDALLQRLALADGALHGTADGLASAPDVRGIRAFGSPSIASFAWDTGDDITATGESIILRGVTLGSSYSLHPPAVGDISATDLSSTPTVARASTADSAVGGWIEEPAGGRELRLAVVDNSEAPVVRYRITVATPDVPGSPDVSVLADTTVGVAWVSGAPGDVMLARFDMTLTPIGEAINLSSSAGASTVPRIAASDSRFMIVWQEEGEGIRAAAVGADGTLLVPATTIVTGSVRRPTIARDLLGGFAVAYETDTGAEVLRMSASAVPAGSHVAFPGGLRPEITAIPEGGLVVAFEVEGRVHVARVGCSP